MSSHTTGSIVTVKVKVEADDDVTVWVDGTQALADTSGLDVPAGSVALAGDGSRFDNVKVGKWESGKVRKWETGFGRAGVCWAARPAVHSVMDASGRARTAPPS